MATHRVQQLDINLGRIQDEATREALLSIVNFVNQTTQRVRTNKDVKANDVTNQNASAGFDKRGWAWAKRNRCDDVANENETAGFDRDGNLFAESLEVDAVSNVAGTAGWQSDGDIFANRINLDGGGHFKATILTGSLASGATSEVFSGATVYGVCGYMGTGSAWSAIGGVNDPGTIVIFSSASSGSIVELTNNNVSTLTYRVIVFHS